MSRDQQQVARRDDLLRGELVAVLLGGDERRDQVLPRRRPAFVDEVAQVSAQPQAGLHPGVELGRPFSGEGDERVESLRQQRRRTAELRLVLDRHAEQPADHRDGQRVGQFGDRIEGAAGLDVVQQCIDQSDDVGFERLDHLGRERLAGPACEAGCDRADRGTGTPARRRAAACWPAAIASWADRGLEPVTRRGRMPQHFVAVPRNRENTDEVAVRQPQRPVLADLPVERVRVGAVGRVEQPHQQLLRFGEFGRSTIVRGHDVQVRPRPYRDRRNGVGYSHFSAAYARLGVRCR